MASKASTSGSTEVAALDSALLKLALTQDDDLEQVLAKALPHIIEQLKSSSEAVRKKVLEICSHVNKRVKDQPSIKLPLPPLLHLAASSASPLVVNFAMVYVNMAFERSTIDEQLAVVPQMLLGVSSRAPLQRDMLLRMSVKGLAALATPKGEWGLRNEDKIRAKFPFLESPADVKTFLGFAANYLLYQPPAQARPEPMAAQANPLMEAHRQLRAQNMLAQGGEVPHAPAAPSGPTICPGLSAKLIAQVEGKAPLTGPTLTTHKLAILNFTSLVGLPPPDVLLHYLIASCDPNEQVARLGDELYRKRCSVDSIRPAVDLEDRQLLQSCMRLFLGSPKNQPATDDKVYPASPALRSKMMSIFTRSTAAANCFPDTLAIVFECVYGDGVSTKLRQQGMEFAVWVFRHASKDQLAPMGPIILQGLLQLLDNEPTSASTGFVNIQGFAYQAVGQLSQRMPQLVTSTPDIALRFFNALATEPPGVTSSVKEAMSPLAEAFKTVDPAAKQQLEKLLLNFIGSQQEAVRLSVVQWARKIFDFDDVGARYVCMLGAADPKFEILEEAKRGLAPPKPEPRDDDQSAPKEEVKWPSILDMLNFVMARHPKLKQQASLAEPLVMQPKAFLAFINFLEECCKHHAGKEGAGKLHPETLEKILQVAEHALVRDSTSELQCAALGLLLLLAPTHLDEISSTYAPRTPWLRTFLNHTNASVRRISAQLLGIAVIPGTAAGTGDLVSGLSSAVSGGDKSRAKKFEEMDGSLMALGYVLAQCVTGTPALSEDVMSQALGVLVGALDSTDAVHVTSAAKALGHVALTGKLPLPTGSSPEDVVDKMKSLLDNEKVTMAALESLGYMCHGLRDPLLLRKCWDAVLQCGKSKKEEVVFAAGESVSFMFGGIPLLPQHVLHSNFSSLSAWHASRLSAAPSHDAQHDGAAAMDVDGSGVADAAGNGAGTDAQCSANGHSGAEAVQKTILDHIVTSMVTSDASEVRCSGSVWLLSIMTFSRGSGEVSSRLSEIQDAFFSLLGESNGLTQEVGSRGLSAVYSAADPSLRKKLLDAFVAALQGGSKRRRVGTSFASAGSSSTSSDSAANILAYNELCSLATAAGHSHLVYWLMDVSNQASVYMAGPRAQAFRFPSISKLAAEQLHPYRSAMIPKLFRYQYDPHPKVRSTMTSIWRALVDDPKAAVRQHDAAIMKDLHVEMGSRVTRNRESACLAMADLVQGRRWGDVKQHLEACWYMTFRALDDFVEPVRLAAMGLFKTLRNLSLRLVDPSQGGSASDSAEAMELVVTLLLEKGVGNQSGDVGALSVDMLAKLCKACSPALVAQHSAQIVPVMLEALSGMEDTRLNYIELHAERLGVDSGRLESARVNASKSSPMWDTLDLCVRALGNASNPEAISALIPKLSSLAKRGVGLNTRVGTAKVIGNLVTRIPSEMKPHASALIKGLLSAARSESSGGVRKAFAATLAQLSTICSTSRSAQQVQSVKELYDDGDASNIASRQLAGLLSRELIRTAGDVFSANGAVLLPVVFLGCHDEDSEVAAIFKNVWDEGAASGSATLRLYASDIFPLLLSALPSSQWGRKKSAAKSIVEAMDVNPEAVRPYSAQLMEALLKELPGRWWDGKEGLLDALAALAPEYAAHPVDSSSACSGYEREQLVVRALVEAASSKKASYRTAALSALERVLAGLQEDHYLAVSPLLMGAIKQHTDSLSREGTPSGSTANGEEEGAGAKPLPLKDVLHCLAAAMMQLGGGTIQQHGEDIFTSIAFGLRSQHAWPVRVEAINVLKALLTNLVKNRAPGQTDAGPISSQVYLQWIQAVVPGVLECAGDAKISQLRSAAIESIAMLSGPIDRKDPAGERVLQDIGRQLSEVVGREKNSVVLAAAKRVLDGLNVPVAMESS